MKRNDRMKNRENNHIIFQHPVNCIYGNLLKLEQQREQKKSCGYS